MVKEEDEEEKKKPKKKKTEAQIQADLAWELRELTHAMRRVVKELTGRVRSHRYFDAVRAAGTTLRDARRQASPWQALSPTPTEPSATSTWHTADERARHRPGDAPLVALHPPPAPPRILGRPVFYRGVCLAPPERSHGLPIGPSRPHAPAFRVPSSAAARPAP